MGPRAEDPAGDQVVEPERIVATHDESAVLVFHRGGDFPTTGGHVTVLSVCTLPELSCRQLADVTYDDYDRRATIVSAGALAG